MADLTEEQASLATKISGSDLTGVETNYVNADANGNLNVIPPSNGPVTGGTVATKSDLVGGQYNSTLPTLTTTQQAAIQLDDKGRQHVKESSAGPVTAGTVAAQSSLAGGQYNTTSPAPTNGQQVALQLDSAGRLLVNVPVISAPVFTNKIRAEVTTSTVSINSTTVYSTIYTYTGSGLFIGWAGEFAANRFTIQMVVDGTETIFNADSVTLNSLAATTSTTARFQAGTGLVISTSNIDISFRYPIKFNTSFVISAKITTGATFNFNQGIMYIQKDT